MLTVDDYRRAIRRHDPYRVEERNGISRAAVAAIMRDRADGAELLFIQRTEHPEDPWSGHMAFPGGRVDDSDDGPVAAAIRETREELALDLGTVGELIGRLSDVPAVGRGRPLPLVIEPYLFQIHGDPEFVPNHEVAAAVWVPLSFLTDRENRSTMDWQRGGVGAKLPCYRYAGYLIWGLTFGMVDELVELVAPSAHGPTGWRGPLD
jgi:8-oxo-dGTP pyrophosphatase MutT (NUDIX family)